MATELAKACIPFEEDLSALIDEELSPEREAEVRAHVGGCSHCAMRLQELCNVDLELAGLAQPTVSAELARGLAERVARDAEAPLVAHVPRDAEAPLVAHPPRDAEAPLVAPTLRVEPTGPRSAPRPGRRRWRDGVPLARVAAAAGLVLAAWLLLRGEEGVAPEPPLAGTTAEERQTPEFEPVPEPDTPSGEILAVQPERPVAPPRKPEAEVLAAGGRTPAPGATSNGALAELPEEDLAMLLELQAVEDLDLIANLELLETLLDLERGAG